MGHEVALRFDLKNTGVSVDRGRAWEEQTPHQHRRWLVAVVLNVLVSVPVKAAIGIVLSLVSLGLTFRSTAKQYFAR